VRLQDRIHRDFAQMQDVTRERFGFLIEAMRAKRIGLVDENDEDADLYGPDDDEDNPTPRRTCCEYLTHRFPDIKQRLRHVFRSKVRVIGEKFSLTDVSLNVSAIICRSTSIP